MKALLAFIKKEFFHVFRDRKTLLLLFGLPVAQIILFGFALTNEISNSKMVICDYAHDLGSMQMISRFEASEEFIVEARNIRHTEIENEFKGGDVKLVLIIPNGFYHGLLQQNQQTVQIIADGSDPNTATTLTNYASNIIRDYQQSMRESRALPLQVEVQVRMIYNPELKGATNFVPGVMALVLLLVCVLMTSVSIVKEKEMGTMEILLVSPFNPFMVIIAKAIPYLLLSWINLGVILLLSVFVLDMPIAGSLLLLLLISTILILTALCLGLLISNVTDSQQSAMLISLMGMLLPTMLFTGFMFPLENMPGVLQVIANIVPSKWYYIMVKAVMIKGLGFMAIWKEALILCGMTAFLLMASIRLFKIRLG